MGGSDGRGVGEHAVRGEVGAGTMRQAGMAGARPGACRRWDERAGTTDSMIISGVRQSAENRGGGSEHARGGGGERARGRRRGRLRGEGGGCGSGSGVTRERGWNRSRTVGMDAIGQSGYRWGHGCVWSTLSS
jgi:hypothetical protein